VHLDRERALTTARQREREAREGRFLGALHGVPFALKDIFDAAGLPTTAGAQPFAHRVPSADATSVARLRAAGRLGLGKVTTTAFAWVDPGGLPLSVQLVGGVFAEARLLGAAAWCERAIGFSGAPRL
jgi:Asp-tRNA(Asn)/Glu-tRNA(Gln) amidotransferase A subunit family amidase